MNALADLYYLRAVDAYPHNLGEVMESLNFALGYDHDHVGANWLMGKFYAEQLNDYARAESYYQVAMASDPRNESVCLDYALMLITTKEFGKAEKLIAYAKKLKGVDLARILHHEGLICECKHEFDKAIRSYERALLESYNKAYSDFIEGEIKRVTAKQKLKKTASWF